MRTTRGHIDKPAKRAKQSAARKQYLAEHPGEMRRLWSVRRANGL